VEGIITGESAYTIDDIAAVARKLIEIESNPEKKKELVSELGKMGYVGFELKQTNSILCYFICSFEEQIWQLRSWYKSGRLQTLLESVFTLLVGNGEKVLIDQLTWNSDDYNASILHLRQLKALGMCRPLLIESTCFGCCI
jgi:predicted SPOUT superfamily RNA methylase MTH1